MHLDFCGNHSHKHLLSDLRSLKINGMNTLCFLIPSCKTQPRNLITQRKREIVIHISAVAKLHTKYSYIGTPTTTQRSITLCGLRSPNISGQWVVCMQSVQCENGGMVLGIDACRILHGAAICAKYPYSVMTTTRLMISPRKWSAGQY